MSEQRYRCVCYTCRTERLFTGIEPAQEFFNEHAEQGHEVELFNQQTLEERSTSWPDTDTAADVDSIDGP